MKVVGHILPSIEILLPYVLSHPSCVPWSLQSTWCIIDMQYLFIVVACNRYDIHLRNIY